MTSPPEFDARVVGVSRPRETARRLVRGRARHVDDLRFPRLAHVAFVRSPHAHARLRRIETTIAGGYPGVIDVIDGARLAAVCRPLRTTLATVTTHASAPQPPLAIDHVAYQGQPVAMVIATTRALAEDAAAAIEVDWEPLEAVARWDAALRDGATVIHPGLGSNLAFEHRLSTGPVDDVFAGAHRVVGRTVRFPRVTGVTLEPRALIAEFDPTLSQLTLHAATQVPHQMRSMLAAALALPEHAVRIVVPDVGGGFGVKLHGYDDELAVAAASLLVHRPLKWLSDRLESFTSDVHAREHEVHADLALDADGRILGMRVDAAVAAGAFSIYPRSSILEGMHTISVAGAPYAIDAFAAHLRVAYQNKVNTGSYRGVGQPVGCGITEHVVDAAARALGIDPAELRRRNLRDAAPAGGKTASGLEMESLSQQACFARLLAIMDYDGWRRRQGEARAQGRYLGIGLAAFLEQVAPGAGFYGVNQVAISAADACILRIEPDGTFTCVTTTLDQGQGVDTGLAQIIAGLLSVPVGDVRIVRGDTASSGVGGGTFASRGLTIGGEAAALAAIRMRERLAGVVAAVRGHDAARFACRDRAVTTPDGEGRMTFVELGRLLHFQQYRVPAGVPAEPVVVAHHVPTRPYRFANGAQASVVEVDVETGMVRLLGHWIVEDCGRIINPLLADEQLRGGIVQGIGAALFEELKYDTNGQLGNASMVDYLVPMAFEMPDIVVDHVETPVSDTLAGVKGVGEAGTVGAAAAVTNAINDALSVFDAVVTEFPCTPERVLAALGKL